MSLPGRPRTYDGILNDIIARLRVLEALPSSGSTIETWADLNLINDWKNAGPPYFNVAYRSDIQVSSEDDFRGTLNAEDAVSGTSIGVLPFANRPTNDFSFLMDYDTGGSDICVFARALVSASDGSITVWLCP